MSTKTLRKRIALVAVASLGFGLMSSVPASAATSTIAIDKIGGGGPSDATLVVSTASSTVSIYTRTTTVALADLKITIGTATTDGKLVLAGGTVAANTAAAATTYNISAAVVNASNGALGTVIGAGSGAGSAKGIASLTATTGGTTYAIWDDATDDKTVAAGEESITLIVYKATATNLATTITNTTAEKAVSCRVAVTCSINIDATVTGTTADNAYYSAGVSAAFTAQPSGAAVVYPTITGETNLIGDTDLVLDNTNVAGSASTVASVFGETIINADITTLTDSKVATVTFVPNATGTYSLTVWGESATAASASSALSGSESFAQITVTVSAGVASITTSTYAGTSIISDGADSADAADGSWGSLLKITIKDANGVAAALANGELCSVDPSGTGDVAAVNNTAQTSTPGAAYNLAPGDFTSGVAYVNIANAVAETVTVAITCGTATATSTHVFKAKDNADGQWTVAPTALTTGWVANTAPAYHVPVTSSVSYSVSDATTTFLATEYAGVRIFDEDGTLTGLAGATYDLAVLAGGSFTLGGTEKTAGGALYELSAAATDSDEAKGSQTLIVTTAARNLVAAGITVTPSSVRSAPAGVVSLVAVVKDQFGVAYANGRVTLSLAGRNGTQAAQSGTTDATGSVTFTVTDTAATTSTLLADTLTITAFDEDSNATPASAPTITWAASTASTITLTSTGDTDVIAGTTKTDISAAAGGATATSATAVALLKDASGNVLAGLPVTFTVTGLTGAEVHTTKVTVYTGSDGKATSNISSYAAGMATVTATAGTLTASDNIYFEQATATEARTIAVSAAGGLVTATVKDRYGNTIKGVTVNATRTGTGYFGAGASTATGDTDKNGVVEFNFVGSGTVTVAFTNTTYGQTYAAAGYDIDATNGTAITASAAGTTVANQKGLGAALAPAGINSASVAVEGANVAADNASAAADAAAEATDAANAATDAANAAAEAADAATAAAQDAADAVAALATSVTEMVNALKKQITSLTNLVIKIQKKVRA
jgi:hypothetical protein